VLIFVSRSGVQQILSFALDGTADPDYLGITPDLQIPIPQLS